jgi:hypothetical protein
MVVLVEMGVVFNMMVGVVVVLVVVQSLSFMGVL